MSIVLLVYLAGLVEPLSWLLFCGGLIGIGTYCVGCSNRNFMDSCKNPKKIISSLVLVVLIGVAIPTEKTLYLMAGASIAQDIANSPKTAATLDKVYKIVDKKLDEQLSEGIDKATKKISSKEVEEKLEVVK